MEQNTTRRKNNEETIFSLFCVTAALLLTLNSADYFAHAASNEDDSLTEVKKGPEPPLTQDSSDTEEFDGYWTKEKMKNATPVDLHEEVKIDPKANFNKREKDASKEGPTDISEPVMPESNEIQALNLSVPSTAGKVFFKYKGNNYVCSGSSINNNSKNLVLTAGHCVHGGKSKGWYSNIVFIPAYNNGSAPYGVWYYKEARAFKSWIKNSNFSHDQAFFTVYPSKGYKLVQKVGGNGLATGFGTNQSNVRIFGWPAEPPYNGGSAYYCEGPTTRVSLFTGDAKMYCEMNGGASGGPWLRKVVNKNLGYVFAVTSRRTTSGTTYLFATPNSPDVKTMYNLMK